MKRIYYIEYPDGQSSQALDEEWILVKIGKAAQKIRLHDYHRIYQVPGLYEEVICRRLKYSSPQVLCALLKKEIRRAGNEGQPLRVIDFGAGNGLSGQCLKQQLSCELLVGVDIIEEAYAAVQRDRPHIYDHYYILDLADEQQSRDAGLRRFYFNTLITVGALGFGDIPVQTFLRALDLLPLNAWIAFNIKDTLFLEEDVSGYKEALDSILGNSLLVLQTKRYRHRYSISGSPLYYYAVIAKKVKEISWP